MTLVYQTVGRKLPTPVQKQMFVASLDAPGLHMMMLVLTQIFLKSDDAASVLINEAAEQMRKEGQELGGSA